jgi:hypothetical protein
MDIQNLLNKILRDFEKVKRPEDAERQGKKAWDMIKQHHLVMCGAEKASQAVKSKIIDRMTKKALTWDTDDASLSSVQKMFNRLASGRYSDAVNLAESSIKVKEEAEKSALKKNAKKGTETKHASNNAMKKKAMEWYVEHQSQYQGRGGKKRAAIDLEAKFPPIKSSTYTRHLKKIK